MRAPASEPDTVLEDVVVTAQKHSQDVQEIGVAITAMSGEEMQALRIQQPLNLSTLSPSLSTMNATTDSTPLFLIRGVGLDDFNMNNSSGVGTYLDEVFASFPGFLTEAMYDVDRVEILKGDHRRHGCDQRPADGFHQSSACGNGDDTRRGISDGHRYGRKIRQAQSRRRPGVI
jgi:outer membrane receptor protein involved in Fe transport